MRRHKPDFWIVILTLILMIFGLVVMYATSPSWAQFQNSLNGGNLASEHYFVRQLLVVIVSIVALVVAYKLPFVWWEKLGKLILLLGVVGCLAVGVLGALGATSIVSCNLGACRAFNLPFGVGLQPVEILKLGLLLYVSALIARNKQEGTLEKKEFLIPLAVLTGMIVVLVAVLEKDLGSTAVMIFMLFCMLVVSGMRWRMIGALLGVVGVLVFFLIVLFPHRVERLLSFSGDGADTHHIDNALIAIGSGGWFGVGIGNSVQATGYLPESINDSIFAVMGETFGFVGLMGVMLVFLSLLMRILKSAQRSANLMQELVLVGVFAWMAGHVMINVMGMTGLIPMKGITLPFLSYGGTSMVFMAAAVGICLQLSGWTRREDNNENYSSGWGERRTHYAGSRRGQRNLEN